MKSQTQSRLFSLQTTAMDCCTTKLKSIIALFFLVGLSTVRAVEPGDVIINELYFPPLTETTANHFQAVELLVVATNANLNGLQVSDRPFWDKPENGQCTLQDLGQGFLSNVPSGTLIVIYRGTGTDDINADDFVLRFYVQSSLFCNVAPKGNPFKFRPQGHALQLLHLNEQVDFVKYRASDATHQAPANPGKLRWENGADGHVDIGKMGENMSIRFLGNKPDLNDFPAAWMPYAEGSSTENNLGEPNGGKNTEWIAALRKATGTIPQGK